MIDDIRPPENLRRDKPKRIEPISRPAEDRPALHVQAMAADPTFKSPQEIADTEPARTEPQVVHHQPAAAKKFGIAWPPSRKQQIIGATLAIVLAFGIGAGWTLTHHKRAVTASGVPTHVRKSTPARPIYSTLTGLPVADSSVNQRPVTAVMVENSLDARPQSGLSQAGVVFEAVAEGGVTRFMALYQDTVPTNVGPIRSARPYYVQWAMGFDAAYAHVGGSPDALQDIATWGVHDLNQFYNGGYYHRVSSRAAPHNVYTGIDTLNKLESAKGYTSSYTGFPRGKDAPAKQPTASYISLSLSGPTYDPSYIYNAATNSYDRSEAGSPHTDAETGKQLSPKVVIALVVPLARGALDSSGAYYSDYNVIGSGQAYVFQNGTLTLGTWSKSANNAQLTFTDAAGKAIPLNRGQTWITAVASSSGVHYQ